MKKLSLVKLNLLFFFFSAFIFAQEKSILESQPKKIFRADKDKNYKKSNKQETAEDEMPAVIIYSKTSCNLPNRSRRSDRKDQNGKTIEVSDEQFKKKLLYVYPYYKEFVINNQWIQSGISKLNTGEKNVLLEIKKAGEIRYLIESKEEAERIKKEEDTKVKIYKYNSAISKLINANKNQILSTNNQFDAKNLKTGSHVLIEVKKGNESKYIIEQEEKAKERKEKEEIFVKIHKGSDKLVKAKFIRYMRKKILGEYKERISKELSRLEGRILLKLIYRKTGKTFYEIINELLDSFQMFTWNTAAKLFDIPINEPHEPEKYKEDCKIEKFLKELIKKKGTEF